MSVAPDERDERIERRLRALMQHEQVMAEAELIARATAQARRLNAAAPVFASVPNKSALDVRRRVHLVRAS